MTSYPSVTITQSAKDEMVARARREWNSATAAYQTQAVLFGRLKANRGVRIQEATEAIDKEIKLAETELARLNKNAETTYRQYNVAQNLKPATYDLIDQFGSAKPKFTTLFSNERDYVYIAASRSGGKSHTARWDEQDDTWRCDCEGGRNRGTCWVVKGVQRGVRLDEKRNPYIIDEKQARHAVARFKREV